MTPSLPSQPNLEYLSKQAKGILRAHRRGDPAGCRPLRRLQRFAAASEEEILAADVRLQEAQFALAMDYGFASWAALKDHVASANASTGQGNARQAAIRLPQADYQAMDVFSLVNQALAESLGLDTPPDYETLHCLSTNAFSLGIESAEDCGAWWHHGGRGASWDLIAALMGWEVRPLVVDGLSVPFARTEDDIRRNLPALARYAEPMREILDSGGAVVTEGGWQLNGPHGFVPWVLWGVITVAGADGTICGATVNGHADNPVVYINQCWSVVRNKPTISLPEADIRMLRRACQRIRGQDPYSPNGHVFGTAATALWIRQMESVPGFCPGCQESSQKGWTCARDNSNTMMNGALSVASYLGHRTAEFPAESRPHVAAAAERYGRIAELLHPAMTGAGGPTYEQFVGDLDAQRIHCNDVLRPVAAEMAAAATDMDQAIHALA